MIMFEPERDEDPQMEFEWYRATKKPRPPLGPHQTVCVREHWRKRPGWPDDFATGLPFRTPSPNDKGGFSPAPIGRL